METTTTDARLRPTSTLARATAPLIAFAAFSLLYFAGTAGRALAKPFWYDELFTVYISRLPSLADIWAALVQGSDQQPPLNFLITRAANTLPLNELIASRLPGLLGYWVMCLSLYRFASRRVSTPYALIAMLLPITTVTYAYAYEARPYGLLLGLCGLALVCWQLLAEGRRQLWAWIGLTLCLSLAIASHFYALILVVPFAAAEVVEFLQRRRWRWEVLLALTLAAGSELLYLPLLRTSAGMASTVSLTTSLPAIPDVYSWLLQDSVAPFLVFGVYLAIPFVFTLPLDRLRAGILAPLSKLAVSPKDPVPAAEYAAAGALVLLPVLVVFVAVYITHGFSPRYIICSIIGVAILAAFGLARLESRQPLAGWLIAAVFVVVAGLKLGGGLAGFFRPPEPPLAGHPLLLEDRTGLPIVVENAQDYLPIFYEATAPLAGRLVYLADPPAAVQFVGGDTPERNLQILDRWVPLHIEPYQSYIKAHRRFLVYEGRTSWLLPQLLADGAQLTVLARRERATLFMAALPP